MNMVNMKFSSRFSQCLLAVGLLGVALSGGAQTTSNVGSSFQLMSPQEAMPMGMAQLAHSGRPTQRGEKTWSFKELGSRFAFNLRGVDGSDSVFFYVRADEVATGGHITLNYSYSPSLLSDYSHINVLVNDEVIQSIPATSENAGKLQTTQIKVPARLLVANNQLRVQLIGHYTLECEDPLHSSLWANVSNQSSLTLDLQRVTLVDDLSILPVPFFDARDPNRLELPFVFLGKAQEQALEASAIVASWFGALADDRGARFTAMQDRFPDQGHAVVFALRDAAQQFLRVGGSSDVASVTMMANPNDSKGKLLLITGSSAEQLRTAAQTLVLGGSVLTGSQAQIREAPQIQARHAYDAPRWLGSERPMKFGELMASQRLTVSGYNAPLIRLNLRLPPDLFTWRASPVDVDLKYRYTVQSGSVNSSLLLGVDQHYLKSLPLLGQEQLQARGSQFASMAPGEMLPARDIVHVPLYQLMNRSELNFRYMYDYIKEGFCKDALLDNVRGQIDPDSTIDISGRTHYLEMPDLAAFNDLGFPFTRMADLSETVVVLSEAPDEAELSAFLTTMGRMGESTGLPATGVNVVGAAASMGLGDKDLLIIGSADTLRATWSKYLPEYGAGQQKQFGSSDLVYRTSDWVSPNPSDRVRDQQSEVSYRSDGRSALLTGFESPVKDGRSVVVLTGTDSSSLNDITDAFLGVYPGQERISGSAVVVRGSKVSPLLAEKTYAVGSLDIWTRIQWTLYKWWQYAGKWRQFWIPALLGLIVLAFVISQIRVRRSSTHKT